MQCARCGADNQAGTRFCEQCGTPVDPATGAATGPTPPGLPQIGSLVAGRYRIVRLLGEGGMGCVYAAEQSLGTTTRKVALKTLHLELSQNEAIRARFEREVATVAKLEHPHTIQVYDFGTTDTGMLYIVMELAVGRSLADVLSTETAVDAQRAVKILTQIAGSLEEAHSIGIIHRDLKPENVMLIDRAGQKDFVKVLDFGIAKNRDEEAQGRKLTQAGTVLGTPPYMSPEQFTGQPLGPQSDIYSLGVMAFELLTGSLPFHATHAWEWATLHMTTPPKSFDEFPRGAQVPQTMRDAIYRALRKAPEERFARVSDFAEALTHTTSPRVVPTAEGRQAPAAPATAVEPTPAPPSPQRPGGTVMGAPIDIGAIPAATFNAPPIHVHAPQPMQHVHHAHYQAAPVAQAGPYMPPGPQNRGGGGKSNTGLILGALFGFAVLGGGAALLVVQPWNTETPKTVLVDNNTQVVPVPNTGSTAPQAPDTSSGGLSVLNDPKVNPNVGPGPGPAPGPGPGPVKPAADAGVKPNPTPVPTPTQPQPTPVPTPKPTTPTPPPLVLPTVWPPVTPPVTPPAQQTPPACGLAATMKGKNPAAYEKYKAECLSKGGRVPGE